MGLVVATTLGTGRDAQIIDANGADTVEAARHAFSRAELELSRTRIRARRQALFAWPGHPSLTTAVRVP